MKVTFVVLNYNGGAVLLDCIDAVLRQSHHDCELIVVDNASSDGSIERAQRAFRHAKVIWLKIDHNVGFALGMNRGIGMAHGGAIVPLNCDAVVGRHFAERAVEVLQSDPSLGVVAPCVIRRTAEAGQVRILDGGPISLTLGMRVLVDRDYTVARSCDKANGACPVYRRSALESLSAGPVLQPFDPIFVTYGEDIDIGCRLAAKGWTVRYEPGVRAEHFRSASSAQRVHRKSGSLREYIIRARYENCARHRRGISKLLGLVLILSEDVGALIYGALRRDRATWTDTKRAWSWVRQRGFTRPVEVRGVAPRVRWGAVTVFRRPAIPVSGWSLDG